MKHPTPSRATDALTRDEEQNEKQKRTKRRNKKEDCYINKRNREKGQLKAKTLKKKSIKSTRDKRTIT